ncbi:hypothetical protein ACROYT_G028524 [Oculina patagonica]
MIVFSSISGRSGNEFFKERTSINPAQPMATFPWPQSAWTSLPKSVPVAAPQPAPGQAQVAASQPGPESASQPAPVAAPQPAPVAPNTNPQDKHQ